MPPDIYNTLIKIISGIAIAVISAWVTVFLSRQKFRSERLWEKKVLAYEKIIEAFHKSKKFTSEHIDAEYEGRRIPDEHNEELRAYAKEGRDEILRASDVGSFLLSEEAQKILARYEAESTGLADQDSWFEYLEAGWSITDKYMKEFIAEAKADLRN